MAPRKPRAPKEAPAKEADAVEAPVEAVVPEEAPAKADKNSATVTWRGMSRTYTREIHGDNFRDLAKQFAGKVGGVVA